MIFRSHVFLYVFILFLVSGVSAKEQPPSVESEQQMGDFSISGYGEKGKKSWDLYGKTADIFANSVKLDDIKGNLYQDNGQVELSADKGDFNKNDGKVHLQQNVVITTPAGARLTTDSLDWDRKQELVSTASPVNIRRDNIVADALGAKGQPGLKKVALEKDVKVQVNPLPLDKEPSPVGKEKIVITCDGPMDIDYEKNIASFYNNVKVERLDSTIYSDRMDVYFVSTASPEEKGASGKEKALAGSKIDKVVARGRVKVVQGDNISTSDEAVYSVKDRKITLNGRPELIIYSAEELQ